MLGEFSRPGASSVKAAGTESGLFIGVSQCLIKWQMRTV